jgi:hypothetical protein
MADVLVTAKASGIAPAITGTGIDGFVITWVDSTRVNVKARILAFDGGLAGDEIQVSVTRDALHPVAALAAGGFAIVWIAKGPPARVLMRRFSSDGTAISDEIQVSSSAVDAMQRPVIARLPDRTLVVAWLASRLDEGVRAAFFLPDGASRGEVKVDGGHLVNTGPLAAAGLQNNSLAIAWRGGENDGSVRTRVQILAPDTTKPVPEKAPNLKNSGDMSMTFLDGGGEPGHFVLAYTSPLAIEQPQPQPLNQTLIVATVFNGNADVLQTFQVTKPF